MLSSFEVRWTHRHVIISMLSFYAPQTKLEGLTKMKSRFSIYFSMVRSPNPVLTPLKSISKIWISSFVNPSKIFVWDGYIFKHFVSSMQTSVISPCGATGMRSLTRAGMRSLTRAGMRSLTRSRPRTVLKSACQPVLKSVCVSRHL